MATAATIRWRRIHPTVPSTPYFDFMALTNDESAVLRLVAAGAVSAHDVARFGGPDVVSAVKVLVGLERKGLVERRVLRDGSGSVRHAAHFLTAVGQRRMHVY